MRGYHSPLFFGRSRGEVTNDSIDWLYGLQSHGIKLGLDGIRALLDLLDHPERAFPTLLVGGTNGKGSVSAMLDAMLAASGRRSGLYTSPHLVRPNERVRVAGHDVGDAELRRVLDVVRAACERGLAAGALAAHPSFFEVMTAAALSAFRDARVDLAVLEVGLGGRLDATNATEPIVSAIVTVGLDHVDTLGTTLEAIAMEKAGIIRAGRPLVSGVVQPDLVAKLRVRCDALGARFVDARRAPLPSGVRLALAGDHQRANAQVATAVYEALSRETGHAIDASAIRRGLETTRWPGRLQWIPGTPSILLDGAHNAAGAEALAAHLSLRGGRKPVLLFASMSDKDIAGILRPLVPHVASVVATQPGVLRAARSHVVASVARDLGLTARDYAEPARALEEARADAGPDGVVLVAGSLYLVGAVFALFDGVAPRGPVSM
jgi:dihydrofolate synthase/folylpolyglutamate synthase